MRAPLPLGPDDEALCALLVSLLPEVRAHLAEPTWQGFSTAEPGDTLVRRARLQHLAKLRVKATNRLYSVAAHLFENVGAETQLHDHRYPLAVFPFALDGASALYEMQWIDSRGSNVVVVASGEVWAIADPTRVRHTVRTLRPHASIVLADVTDPPTRADRMVSTSLAPAEIRRVREIVHGALVRMPLGSTHAAPSHGGEERCGGADVED